LSSPSAALAWTPETPRHVPITEIPLLAGAVDSHIRARIRQSVMYIVSGGIWALAAGSLSAGLAVLPLVLLVVPAIQSLVESIGARRELRRRQEGRAEWTVDRPARFAYWLATRRATFVVTAAGGVAVVALCQVVGGLQHSVEAAGLVKSAVRGGQWWRLLTGSMLHANAWHFGGNVGALLALGRITEVLAGWSRAALVLLISVLCGSLFSLWLMPNTNSVGLSGGLLGLLGFLIVLGLRYGAVLPAGFMKSLVKGVAWVAVAGFVAYRYIDNAAHAGGLVAGLALGLVLVPTDEWLPLAEPPALRAAGIAAAAILALAALASAFLVLPRA
jgi:membrane associated rhomboid family serine protease